MQEPDGSKQADREAEVVAAEDKAEFEEWQRQRAEAARKPGEVVRTIPDHEVGLDDDNDPIDKRNGRLVQRTDDGWEYLPEWPHRSFEYKGDRWDYREPKPIATIFFATASDPQAKAMDKLRAIMSFLEHTLSPKSYKLLQRRGFNHDDDFDQADMSEIVRMIAEGDTGRPTTQS